MEDTAQQSSGQYESKAESDQSREDFVKRWLAEIELASKSEKDWRKESEQAREVYRAEKEADGRRFNILFSNVQTSVPALYNSTPIPDVRTRYSDRSELSRLACTAVERVLSYSVDTYNFDGTLRGVVQDRELAGRGAARVRYMPYMYQAKLYQEVNCEHVAWKHMRLGPCLRWEDLPWLAYEHFLTREQLMKLAPKLGGGITLDVALDESSNQKPDVAPNVFKRARVWEIWDKSTRKVIWIAPSYRFAPIREDDDPLGLTNFYDMPEPLYAIRTSDSMVPVCPYRVIKPLAEELEELTERIQSLIKVCRWRGIRHPAIPSFEMLEDAVDGELVAPVEGSEILSLVQGGSLEKFVWLMPIDQLIKVIQQLYLQREQIKQTIFEVSGLADIMRGQTDPNETLGAQEIKANFGTMRLQEAQKEVARFCRDLFRLKAEIACNKFDSRNLAMMTGMELPSRKDVVGAKAQLQQMQQQAQMMAQQQPAPPQPGMPPQGQPQPQSQPPQPPPELIEKANAVAWEDVLEVLKSGMMRSYRVDIETDSTVRGDVRQAQQNATGFLQGTAQFMQAMAPAVESGFMKPDVAVDLFASMARLFKLGKQAEDALSRMSQEAEKQARNPPPQGPSPEEMKMKAEMEKSQNDMAMAREKHKMDMEKFQAGLSFKQQDQQLKVAGKQQELAMDQQAQQQDMAHQEQQAYLDFANQQHQARLDARTAEQQAAFDEAAQARKAHFDDRKARLAEAMSVQKHQRQMSQSRAQARPQ